MNTEPNPSAPAVEAAGLTKIYGSGVTEVVAVREVSLRVERGEVVALLGPSGAGKSTLLTILGLINPPTTGRLVIGGLPVLEGERPLTNLAAFRRQHLGFVFQKANLIGFLNAVQNVQIALEINDVPPRAARCRAMELLDYLGVAECADHLPDALSGGQQQRVAVARALANEPKLILADEPTAALDGARGLQVMELFARVAHERGAGVIVVTHDHRALEVFDRVLQMEDGRVWPAEKPSFSDGYTRPVASCRPQSPVVTSAFRTFRISDSPGRAAANPQTPVRQPLPALFSELARQLRKHLLHASRVRQHEPESEPNTGEPTLPGAGPGCRETELTPLQSTAE